MAAKKARKTKKAPSAKQLAARRKFALAAKARSKAAKAKRPAKKRNATIIKAKRIDHLDVSKIHSLGKTENPRGKKRNGTTIKARKVTILNLKKNPAFEILKEATPATKGSQSGWKLGKSFYAKGRGQAKLPGGALLDLGSGFVYRRVANPKRKAKGNPPRFVVQSLKGIKFHHAQGYTQGSGYGVFDIEKGMFVADAGSYHAWDYKQKAVAQSIVDQFNKTGPKAALHYARVAEPGSKRKQNIAGFMADGVFHPIRSGVEQRTTKSGVRRVKSKKAYKPSKVGEKRTYSAKKSAKRAAQSRRMTAATKQRKATTTRLASRLLDRSGPLKKTRRNPNADTKSAYESFQGKPSTKSTSLNFPNGTPANVYKLGTLHSITLQSGAVVKPAGKTVWLCADTKGKLHLGTSGERLVNAPKGALGKVREVEYITTKPHLGDNKPTRYYHELGEETGQKPTLYSDGNGGLLFKGGATYIPADGSGIHN